MSRLFRDVRLLPIVLAAAIALLSLKTFGLLLDGGYILADPSAEARAASPAIVASAGAAARPNDAGSADVEQPPVPLPTITAAQSTTAAPSKRSWAQEMFNFPDVTGSVPAKKDAGAKSQATAALAEHKTAAPAGKKEPVAPPPVAEKNLAEVHPVSPAERAILERLQDRRKELDARGRALDMREALIKAAEKRLQARIAELKKVEGRIKLDENKKDQAEAARFKSLISMYESMKAKDAARIFNRLDMKILAEVASHINPRQMGDILANMSPEIAERLTVEFASRAATPQSPPANELPKIKGRPSSGS